VDPRIKPVELRDGAIGAEAALKQSMGMGRKPEEDEDDNLTKAEDDNPENSSAGV
jgi:hypothetical protein